MAVLCEKVKAVEEKEKAASQESLGSTHYTWIEPVKGALAELPGWGHYIQAPFVNSICVLSFPDPETGKCLGHKFPQELCLATKIIPSEVHRLLAYLVKV